MTPFTTRPHEVLLVCRIGRSFAIHRNARKKSCTAFCIMHSRKYGASGVLRDAPYGYWSKFPIILGVLYLGSHYNTGPYINFPHFGNSNLGKLPYVPSIASQSFVS